MSEIFTGFRCKEYLDEEYKNGYFHLTEAWELFEHKKVCLSNDGSRLFFGAIYDDHDLRFFFDKKNEGIWAEERSGLVFHFSDSIQDMVEGWYPGTAQRWREMDSETQWENIYRYFKRQESKYHWQKKELVGVLDICVESGLNKLYFVAAYENYVSVSIENPFLSRAKKRLVNISYSDQSDLYIVNYNENFFTKYRLKSFIKGEIEQSVIYIKRWLDYE